MDREISEIGLLELLPQRPPFVMLDRVLSCDGQRTLAELTVREDNLFFSSGHLSVPGMIEGIAQTCAARIGYLSLKAGGTVKIGVIGAISRLEVKRTPLLGETIVFGIEIMEEVFQMTLVHATVCVGDDTLCDAQMKIALTENS